MRILVVNGPNLNMLGIREPEIYGRETYETLCARIREKAAELGAEVTIYQSNHEGDLVTAIQQARGTADAIVINPAAYTHTSIAILDALRAAGLPAAEVHLSDISKREPFRRLSYAGMACGRHYIGLGTEGYLRAMEDLAACGKYIRRAVCIPPARGVQWPHDRNGEDIPDDMAHCIRYQLRPFHAAGRGRRI